MKQKKLFLVIFGFLGEKLSLDYVINTKSQILPVKIFFRKIYFLAQKQVCNQKRDKKFFTSNFCFSFWEKNAYHTIFIYENFMINIFLTEFKIMFLIVKKPSIIDIII